MLSELKCAECRKCIGAWGFIPNSLLELTALYSVVSGGGPLSLPFGLTALGFAETRLCDVRLKSSQYVVNVYKLLALLHIGDIFVFPSAFVILGCHIVHFRCNVVVILQMFFVIVVGNCQWRFVVFVLVSVIVDELTLLQMVDSVNIAVLPTSERVWSSLCNDIRLDFAYHLLLLSNSCFMS